MRNRWFGISLVLLCAFVLAPVCAEKALAQTQSAEKPVMYTYVSEWSIPRGMWGDYAKTEAEDADMLKKAVADGTLVAFGSFAVLNHQEGSPTHGTWFSASSMANILKFLENLRNLPNATSAPLAAAKHWDYILQSRNYAGHSGTFTNAYLRVGNWRPKAGSSDPDSKILKATMVALCEKLLADGALHGYEIDEETVHSSDPGTITIALMTNGPEGLDKFNSVLEESQKSNPAGWAGFGGTIDPAGHRDTLARIGTMTRK